MESTVAPPGHRWCKNCSAFRLPDPDPDRGGRCNTCKCAMKGSKINAKQPVDPQARAEHLKRLVAEYAPQTYMAQSTCEQLAAILERLDKIKPGGADHQRLVQLAGQLGERLEESRPSRASRDAANLDAMTTDELIAETSAILRGLLETRDAKAEAQAGFPAGPSGQGVTTDPALKAVPPTNAAASEAGSSPDSGPEPRPEPDCPFCMRPCVGEQHDSYSVLHWTDPAEVDKRAKAATAEMLESFRRQRFGDPWIR